MSIEDALKHAGAKPAGKRPYFLDRETERVLAIAMAAVQELAVARQRIDTLERVLIQRGLLAAGEIDAFEPTLQAAIERAQWTQEYLARVLRIVQQENEAAALENAGIADPASEDVAAEVSRGG